MTEILLNRRAVLVTATAGAGVLFAMGVPAVLASPPQDPAYDIAAWKMVAAWVLLYPDSHAEVRLACLNDAGEPVRELPPVRLCGDGPGGARPASAWRQAQEASLIAQTLAAAMMARAWEAPRSECEVRPGCIAHTPTGRSIPHRVWVDIV